MNSVHYSFISGSCGALASIFGKLCGLEVFEGKMFIFSIIFFLLMIAANAGVWAFYTKAIAASGHTLGPTVMSSSCNYLLSTFAGIVLFGETVSLKWWIGITLIIFGLMLVTDAQKVEDGNRKKS